ncbi:MAG: N-acetylmuramoyl-L-alanine amidase, partial [Deltaproteobacteria bacterium]
MAQVRGRGKVKFGILLAWMFTAALVMAGPAAGRSLSGPSRLLEKADRCRKSLMASSAKRKYRHNWMACIRAYRRIVDRYPGSDPAGWALYRSARLYTALYRYSRRAADLDEAIRLYRQLADKYPKHRVADDGQYRIGEIFYKYRKDLPQAYVEFLKLDIKFPSGDMRPMARKRLDELAVILGNRDEGKAAKKKGASPSVPVTIRKIRHWSTPNYTRVVLDLAGPVTYKPHLLKSDPAHEKPRRLYLDLRNARFASDLNQHITIKDGLLRSARVARYSPGVVRVVLDMEKSIGSYKVFHLYDPFRIVVDVRQYKAPGAPGTRAGKSSRAGKRRVRKGIRKADLPDRTASLARQLGLNVQRIVIDPGHGGKDPGCNRSSRIKEKDIVLSIAKILKRKIEKEIGCEVILTRTRDVFVPLERRTAFANTKKADLFVSLHVNAHRSSRIRGVETYFLNMATDERAVRVAARENATSEKNISDLQAILNDLMLNTKIHESSRLAHDVQEGIISQLKKRYHRADSLGVKQAPFYV